MNLLAIETSSDACSVALQFGDAINERHVVEERRHTSILMPMIEELLSDAGIRPSQLTAVVLGNGPGSFIGMRIGASVAQGICYGAELQLVPVSSLAAVAAEAMDSHSAERVLVAQDARMNQVYVGQFERDAENLPAHECEERIVNIAGIEGLDQPYVAAGAGWQKYPNLASENRNIISEIVDIRFPRARFLLGLGARAIRAGGAIAPNALELSYIREKVAEKPGATTG